MIYNKALINILEQVSTIKSKQGAVFPARAYDKAKEFIILNNSPIKSMDDLMDKPQIGKSALNVLKEYMETGTVTMIEKAKKDPMYVLSNIFGIGPKKSRDLVKNHHINSIAELSESSDMELLDAAGGVNPNNILFTKSPKL